MFIVRERKGLLVFTLNGDVGHEDMASFEEELDSRLSHKPKGIVLQMDSVEHVNYQCLQRLVHCGRVAGRSGAEIKIAGPCRYVRDIMKFVGADRHFRIFATLAQAIESYGSPEAEPAAKAGTDRTATQQRVPAVVMAAG